MKFYLFLVVAASALNVSEGLKTNIERERRDRTSFVYGGSSKSSKGKGKGKGAPSCEDFYYAGILTYSPTSSPSDSPSESPAPTMGPTSSSPPTTAPTPYPTKYPGGRERNLRNFNSAYTRGKGKGKGKSSKCVPSLVSCFESIMSYAEMERSLNCEQANEFGATGGTGSDVSLTLIGPEAELDCKGNMIFSRGDPPGTGTIGVQLIGGATIKNCFIKGFDIAVEMIDGDNTVEDSTIFRNTDGIKSTGGGCNSVENTQVINSFNDAISVLNHGVFILKDSQVLDSNSDGIVVDLVDDGGEVYVVLEDSSVFTTHEHQAFGIEDGGQVFVELYGENRFVDSSDQGFKERSPETASHTSVYGELIIEYSGEDGLDLQDGGVLVIRDEAILEVCNSNQKKDEYAMSFYVDINVGKNAAITHDLGGLVCGSLDLTSMRSGLVCDMGCVQKDAQALACRDMDEAIL